MGIEVIEQHPSECTLIYYCRDKAERYISTVSTSTSRYLKVSKFQNEFMKSWFFPKYEPKIVRIFAQQCGIGQDRVGHNVWFIFWEKR